MKLLSTTGSVLPIAIAALAPNDPGIVLWWILGLAGFAALANQVITLFRNLTGSLKEQPPPSLTYQRKDECAQLHAGLMSSIRSVISEELRKVETQHEARTNQFREDLRHDIGGVHRRVDMILARQNGEKIQ